MYNLYPFGTASLFAIKEESEKIIVDKMWKTLFVFLKKMLVYLVYLCIFKNSVNKNF